VNEVTLTLCIVAISCGAYPETLDGVDDAASDPPELLSDGAAEADDPASWVTGVVVFVNAEIIRVRVGAATVVAVVVTVVVGVVTVAVGVVTVAVGVVTVAVGVVTVVAATATPLAEPGLTTAT
jgi:hypothetical protein